MRKAKQSTAKNVMVLMVGAADHITGLAGLTLTITASKDGAAFAGIAPSVTDRGSGWYAVALTAAHTDTLGDLALHVTGAAADPVDMVLLVEGGTTDVDVSSRSVFAGGAVDSVTNSVGSVVGLTVANLDVAVSSRLATAGYTAPDNAGIAAIPDAATNAAAVLASAVDGIITLAESIRLQNAVLAGKVSGAGTGTETFRDLADTKDRIVATLDTDGNRTAITRDAT